MERARIAGFTLVELGIVIVIISLLLAVVLRGEFLIGAGKAQDAIALSKDLSVALRDFKQRYHMYPGDFPVDHANPEIPNVRAECKDDGANKGDGDGVISISESRCVPEVLSKAGIGKADFDSGSGWLVFNSRYGPAKVMAARNSSVPALNVPSIVNVLQFENLPCAIAQEIDRKIDNGDLGSGKAAASVSTCTPNNPASDPVAFFAVAL